MLFIRSSTGLELTESGRVLLPWAHRLVHDSDNIREMMSSLGEEVAGELRISCSTTAGKYVLPKIVARFCARYPAIRAQILTCRPERATLNLMDGESHIGVVSSEIVDPSIESQPFFHDRVLLIVPSMHRWAGRESIEPQELLEEQLNLREPESGTRRAVFSELAKYDIALDDLDVLMELGNAEAIVATVAAGYGISFVSALAANDQIKFGNLVSVRVEGLDLLRTIYMIRKPVGSPHRPRDVFWSFIHASENADVLSWAGQLELA